MRASVEGDAAASAEVFLELRSPLIESVADARCAHPCSAPAATAPSRGSDVAEDLPDGEER